MRLLLWAMAVLFCALVGYWWAVIIPAHGQSGTMGAHSHPWPHSSSGGQQHGDVANDCPLERPNRLVVEVPPTAWTNAGPYQPLRLYCPDDGNACYFIPSAIAEGPRMQTICLSDQDLDRARR